MVNLIIIVILIIITLFCMFTIVVMKIQFEKKLASLLIEQKNTILKERENAIKRSKDVTRGNISEEFIPLFPDFPYDLSECKFSGKPVDYIIYKGMNEVRDGKEAIVEIIFADVKVGGAQRTKVQNAIKKALEEGRVRWETWRIGNDKKITIK